MKQISINASIADIIQAVGETMKADGMPAHIIFDELMMLTTSGMSHDSVIEHIKKHHSERIEFTGGTK